METVEEIKIRFMPHITEKAAPIVKRAVLSDFPALCRRINRGDFELYEVNDGEAYFVTESQIGEKRILFVHVFAGKNIVPMFEVIERAARNAGFDALMYQTHRPGMRRHAERFGFDEVARTYRKPLK